MKSDWTLWALVGCLVNLLTGCHGEEPKNTQPVRRPPPRTVRPPAVAGAFYPESVDLLRAQVGQALRDAKQVDLPGRIIGLVAPHAGYVYCADVAAWSYKQLVDLDYDTVVLLGPSHHVAVSPYAVSPADAFRTPLGEVPIEATVRSALLGACPRLQENAAPHAPEHSLEVQLPFLQTVLHDFKIVPIVIGQATPDDCRALAKAIAPLVATRNLLVVASSDLAHYPKYEDAEKSDKAMLAAIEKLDSATILATDRTWMHKGVPNLVCTACGLWPIVTLTMVTEEIGGCAAKVLKYANSGDVPGLGDKSRVVGYGAVVVYRKPGAHDSAGAATGTSRTTREGEYVLDRAEQQYLLKLARQSLEACVSGKPLPKPASTDPRLTRKSGAFVTLKKNGRLRGCIGYIVALTPLQEAVVRMARAAALEDYRFPPVKPEEVPDIDIEISVLSPLRPIKSVDEITVGKHGLVMTYLGRRGVLLPQVPVEQKWDLNQYLTGICRKTGVPDRSWEKGARIEVFTAQVFGEEKQ